MSAVARPCRSALAARRHRGSKVPSRHPPLTSASLPSCPLCALLFLHEYLPPFSVLRRYNKEALRLRIFYLLNQPAGAESNTVLVQVWPTPPRPAQALLACGGRAGMHMPQHDTLRPAACVAASMDR